MNAVQCVLGASAKVQEFVCYYCRGQWGFCPVTGRHWLHTLCDCMKCKDYWFDVDLWNDLIMLSDRYVEGGIDVRSRGPRPPSSTVLEMAAKQPWCCQNLGEGDQTKIVEMLLAMGADINSTCSRGNSVIMQVAGAGNVSMFRYFCERIRVGAYGMDLSITNTDGRNLYSMAGLAHDAAARGGQPSSGKDEKPCVNGQIKNMVRGLVADGYMAGGGKAVLLTCYRSWRKRPRRTVDQGTRGYSVRG